MYQTALISPLTTVPWPIEILVPRQISPTMVAFGATKLLELACMGLSQQRGITLRALVQVSLNLLGASRALDEAQKRNRRTPFLMILFNMLQFSITTIITLSQAFLSYYLIYKPSEILQTWLRGSILQYINYLSRLIIVMLLSRVLNYFIRTSKLKPGQYNFLDLVRAPVGSQIPITPEEKEKINIQIDKKLQQLEDSGLSREEILLSKSQKGLPLAIDPFFQYIKKNRLARDVYLKRSDRFTVEKIVDIALRQDIGPDPSYSRTRDNGKINEKGRAEIMNDLQERQKQYFSPASYYANKETTTQKLYDELKPHQALRHIYNPINRYQRLQFYQRRLKKYDIHWRNIQLLRQFMTSFGNIKSRFANRLSRSDQKKVIMAIKTARHNCALPFYGRTLNSNKKNITSIEEEVKELGLQNVNLETGQIYYSRAESMDRKEVQNDQKRDADWRYEQMIKGNNYQLWIETPDKEQDQEMIKAEKYARHVKITENEINKVTQDVITLRKKAMKNITGIDNEDDNGVTPEKSEEFQVSYESRKKKINKKLEENPLSFSEIILEEKTLI